MKRLFAFLLILCLLCVSTVVIAEEKDVFTLRNGIQFGMTKDEVFELEAQNGWTFEWANGSGACNYYIAQGTVAGYENGIIVYCFENDKLVQCTYSLETKFKDGDQINAAFTKREKELEKKYGTTEYSSLTKGLRYPELKLNGYYRWIFCEPDILYSQRILNYDNLVVYIDHSYDEDLNDRIEITYTGLLSDSAEQGSMDDL